MLSGHRRGGRLVLGGGVLFALAAVCVLSWLPRLPDGIVVAGAGSESPGFAVPGQGQAERQGATGGALAAGRHPAGRAPGAASAGHNSTTSASAFASAGFLAPLGGSVAAILLLKTLASRIYNWFETPSRPYGAPHSVGDAYDDWTRDGILEHYWGEHIHMGSYTPMDEQTGYRKEDNFLVAFFRATLRPLANFKQAKIVFTEEMIEFSRAVKPAKILDVGCGIGGSSRILAKKFPDAEVVGITLSPEQAARAGALAKEAGLTNCRFEVMNALEMTWESDTFDLVWGCESGEHMPDKKKYIEEMSRVLKPGGKLVVATWCERDPEPAFTPKERATLDFLYAEWSHPYFISLNKYKEHLLGTNLLSEVETADWTEQTLPSWRHSVWVGAWSPWYWMKLTLQRPKSFLGILREIWTLEKYHQSMVDGLMVYGMMRATKK